MTDSRFTALSDEEFRWLHTASEQFEQALKTGASVSIEAEVDRAAENLKAILFEELLAIELEIRFLQGETLSQADYDTRFPSLKDQVESVFKRINLQGELATIRPCTDTDATWGTEAGDHQQRFQVIRMHAKGGLGEVSLAHDRQLHRDVAVKRIHPRYVTNKAVRERFLLEAEVTGRLEHPGVVPVYELGEDRDSRPYYAMRLIKGDSLRDAADQLHSSHDSPDEKGLLLRKLLGRFVTVCNTIHYAHSRGVLHRDLKPSNIMLGDYGETLVVDWGLAKVPRAGESEDNDQAADPAQLTPQSGDSMPTVFGSAIGTPAFMPPEQAAGRMDELGPTSDVFSLGATLYYVLTGHPPHAPNAPEEILEQVKKGQFERPREQKADVPAALEAICLKAMANNQRDRYTDPRQLADDLEAHLAGEPTIAHSEGLTTRLQRWVRKHPKSVAGLAASVLVGLLGAVSIAAIVTRNNQDLQELTATAQLEAKEADLIRDFFVHHLRPSRFGEASVDYQQRGQDVIELKLRSPLRRAEIMAQLGEVFANMGDLARANEHLLRAEAICNRLPEASNAERRDKVFATAKTDFYLGRLRHSQGRDDEAVRRLRSALASFRKKGLDRSDPRFLQAEFDLTLAMNNTKSMHDAQHRRAEFAEVNRILAEQVAARSDVPEQLALLKFAQGGKKFHEAEFANPLQKALLQAAGAALMEEVRKLCADLPEGSDASVQLEFYDAFLQYELSKSRSLNAPNSTDPHKRFVQRGQQALVAIRRAFGRDTALFYELSFAKSVNDVRLKRRLLLNNVDSSRIVYGSEPTHTESLYALAEFLEQQQEFEGAELRLREVVDLLQEAFQLQPHWRIGFAKLQLGRFLVRQQRWQEASHELRQANDVFAESNVAEYSDLGVACKVELERCLAKGGAQ